MAVVVLVAVSHVIVGQAHGGTVQRGRCIIVRATTTEGWIKDGRRHWCHLWCQVWRYGGSSAAAFGLGGLPSCGQRKGAPAGETFARKKAPRLWQDLRSIVGAEFDMLWWLWWPVGGIQGRWVACACGAPGHRRWGRAHCSARRQSRDCEVHDMHVHTSGPVVDGRVIPAIRYSQPVWEPRW